MHVYPSFGELKRQYESDGLYLRLPSDEVPQPDRDVIANRPVIVGLDVGSTMAKMTVADAADGTLLALSAFAGCGPAPVDLLVTDVLMPGMSGLEVVDKLLNVAPSTKVMLLTSSESEEDLLTSIKAGRDSFLPALLLDNPGAHHDQYCIHQPRPLRQAIALPECHPK